MSRRYYYLGIIFSGILCLMASLNAQARVNLIISVAPPIPEAYAPPSGYSNCYIVPAGFYNGIWINAHRECNYANHPNGSRWIAGYWACSIYDGVGNCGRWGWVPGRWWRHGPRYNHPPRYYYGRPGYDRPGYGRPVYGRPVYDRDRGWRDRDGRDGRRDGDGRWHH